MDVTTRVEKTYKRRQDGLYQQVLLYFIQFTDPSGRTVSHLDKTELGGIFKEAGNEEHSRMGVEEELVDEKGQKKRLIAIWLPT